MRAQARSIAKAVARGGGTSASCSASCSSAVSSEFCFSVIQQYIPAPGSMDGEERRETSGPVAPGLEREPERGPGTAAFTAERLAMIDQLIAAHVSVSTDLPPRDTAETPGSSSAAGESSQHACVVLAVPRGHGQRLAITLPAVY